MKKFLLPLFIVAALVAACVPSVNPFYTEKDVITDARLLGVWQEDKDKDKPAVWDFSADEGKVLKVSIRDDDGKTGKLTGNLFKLGNQLFLDLTPEECEFATNQTSIVGIAMIPGHLLMRVKLEDAKLNLCFCNPDWIKKYLTSNPKAVAHRIVDGGVILTADTAALQKFVKQHLGVDELFGDGEDYKRIPAAAK